MTDLSPETVGTTTPDDPRADDGLGVEWLANLGISFVAATLVAAGWWIAMGEPAGGRRWFIWAVVSYVTSAIIDIRRSRAALTAARSHGGM